MPSWNTHLEAGHRLAKQLKLTGPKRQEFLFGCILPDINNGYINNVKVRKRHQETHYAFNDKSTRNFYAENQAKIDAFEPLYLGYLFHLYTDGYFNHTFYHEIKKSDLGRKLDPDEWREIKHNDFWLYDTTFYHTLGFKKKDLLALAKHANEISVTEITPEDIENVEYILTSGILHQKSSKYHYRFYDQKRLDDLLEQTIADFTHDYLRSYHA